MVDSLQDLKLEDSDTLEEIYKKIQDGLGISVYDMRAALSKYVVDKAEELAKDFVNIIPFGDYDRIIEDYKPIVAFLRDHASKEDNWELYSATLCETNNTLISFYFKNLSVDDGEALSGFVYVSFSGKIKHTFAQGEN
jgi:hypothetical protein